MEMRESIFGSKKEQGLFETIRSNWAQDFEVYPNLAVSQVISFSHDDTLTKEEKEYLRKTSIDYTICDRTGKPLLGIEFDGMGRGFSNSNRYIPKKDSVGATRRNKIGLKLKAALMSGFPLVVVSYQESSFLKDEKLTVVDGIIGKILANRHLHIRVKELFENSEDGIQQMNQLEKQKFVQDLADEAEVEGEMKWNPVAKKAAEYEMKIGWKKKSYEYLHDPELPDIKGTFDTAGIEKRCEALKKNVKVGCKVTIKTSEGSFAGLAWMRNIECLGFSAASLVCDIAELFAFKAASSAQEKRGDLHIKK